MSVIGTHGASEDQESIFKTGCGVCALFGHLKWCTISSINSSIATTASKHRRHAEGAQAFSITAVEWKTEEPLTSS